MSEVRVSPPLLMTVGAGVFEAMTDVLDSSFVECVASPSWPMRASLLDGWQRSSSARSLWQGASCVSPLRCPVVTS